VRHLFQIELPLRQDWEAIGPLRQSVTACLKAVFRDHALCESLAMVAGELLENAVKYGARQPGSDRGFALSVVGGPSGVELEVSNPIDQAEPGYERLLAEIARIARAPSPQEAYLEAMRRVAISGATGSLGLARIAHEGGCDVSASLGTDGLLRVRAITRRVTPIPPTAAPPA
jgi:anti-sigma regulatory factor (Ser/Thr protein kinase)